MRLLITGAWKHTTQQIEEIKDLGFDVYFMPDEKGDIPIRPDMVDGVICNGLFLHHSIEQFASLKFIQLTSAGYDRVPMNHVKAHGIKINNAKGVYSIPMAEYAVSGVLYLYKHLSSFVDNQKKHIWEKDRGLVELYAKNVCIIGAGNVGGECAKRFKAFGCNVVGVDLHEKEDELFGHIHSIEHIDKLLSCADIVVLTLPLTQQTKYLFDKERFSFMKKGAILVNISRGAIVDEKALEIALGTVLGGAVLDVFEQEPLDESSKIWEKKNVIITPHNSFVGEGNNERLFKVIFDFISRV